jgi:hypothetical protein
MTTTPPQIESVLFPVVVADVSVSHLEIGHITTRHKAIVDKERKRVLAVVTDDYRLITNAEAIERGKALFRQVFSETTNEKMELYNVILPASRSFCHVDFTLQGYTFAPAKGDDWFPFLRVTNSYNKTKPLRFDMGFCRAICRNGMIFDPRQVTVRRYHTRGAERSDKDLAGLDLARLKAMEAHFLEKLLNLKRYAVPPAQMLPLVCKVFDLQVTSDQIAKPAAQERWKRVGQRVGQLTTQYFGDLGHNGYAALNVLTDVATRPKDIGLSEAALVHPYQARTGLWIDDFIHQIEQKSFTFEEYLASHQPSALNIEQALTK